MDVTRVGSYREIKERSSTYLYATPAVDRNGREPARTGPVSEIVESYHARALRWWAAKLAPHGERN